MSKHDDSVTDLFGSALQDERAYLLSRAEEHRQRSEATTDYPAKMIHDRLCQLYAERADQLPLVDTDQDMAQHY